jgi:hypothetical protein
MTELGDLGAEVRRLMNAVFDGTEVEISNVSLTPRVGENWAELTIHYRVAGKDMPMDVGIPLPANPIHVAWFYANELQRDVICGELWAQSIPPCGAHDRHPANIEYEGPAGLRLECPYGDWSREIR